MPRTKRERPLPPGARRTSAGRITLQIPCTIKGKTQRLSQNAILSTEPRSYGTVDEAWAGYATVLEFLKQQVDHTATVAGFRDRWLDESDARWGIAAKPKRGVDTRRIYAARTAGFVAMFGTRPMASITEADILAYQRSDAYTASQMVAIGTLLRDAAADRLRVGNPATAVAKEANDALRWRRENHKPVAPTLAQVDAALAFIRSHPEIYPRSLYGWLLTGARTGLRGGELDGMQFEFCDGDRYLVRWQLHYRTNRLQLPKWVRKPSDCRKVFLPEDVRREIQHARMSGGEKTFIWENTFGNPWRHDARDKWWDKQVDGTSLREIVGGVSIYNATRHHWASWAVNVAGISPYQVSEAFGHKDGGALIIERYLTKDRDSIVDAIADAYAAQPVDLDQHREQA